MESTLDRYRIHPFLFKLLICIRSRIYVFIQVFKGKMYPLDVIEWTLCRYRMPLGRFKKGVVCVTKANGLI